MTGAAGQGPAVVHILGMNPNKRGPVELQLLEMSRQLAERGERQEAVFAAPPPHWYAEALREAGCAFSAAADPTAPEVVERAARAGVVHLHFVSPQPLIGALRRAGARSIVLTEHTYRAPQRLAPARAMVRHLRTRHVTRFVAVSEFIRAQTRRDFLISDSRIRLILNGVDLDRFLPAQDPAALRRELPGVPAGARVATVAAHLHPAKRVDLILGALPAVADRVPAAHLVVAGDGPERDRLHTMADELGVAGRVTFLHGDNRVERIYGASDVAVSASSGEGLSSAAVEAQACGLPLVATAAGAQRETFEDGRTGVLVTDETAHGLAAALAPLLGDPERSRAMGRAARERAVARFDVRRMAAETLELYRSLPGVRTSLVGHTPANARGAT